MIFACQTADKNIVIQNDKTNFEIRIRGIKNVDSFAKAIQHLNSLDKYELEMLSRIITQEITTKNEF
jgi:hypothetical protein